MAYLARTLARWTYPLWVRGVLVLTALALAAGGLYVMRDLYCFYGGRFFDDTGRYGRAVEALESFVSRHPDGPQGCEARLRLGRIYTKRFGRYGEALRHLEGTARMGGPAGCVAQARSEIMDCPDYFPIDAGRSWVYGDTASGGRNMRQEVELRLSADGRRVLQGVLFAGKKRISVSSKAYHKRDWGVWESVGGAQVMVLRFPFRAGSSWTAKRGASTVAFHIEADGLSVKTQAGTFSGCIKVREKDPKFPGSWKFDYFAPGVGRVKTTVGAPGVENPNTELISYRIP